MELVSKSTVGYGFKQLNYDDIGKSVESIIFGNGSIRVTTMFNDDMNLAGVSFCEAPPNRPIGEIYIRDNVPKDKNEDPLYCQKNAKHQMLFDNVASIDVVIARLQEAKKHLLDKS